MQVTIAGILYETAVMHEGADTHTPVLIPVSDKTLAQLADEGKILIAPASIKEIENVQK